MSAGADVSFSSILLFCWTFLAVNRGWDGRKGRSGLFVIVSLHSSFFAGMSEACHQLSKNNKSLLPNFLDN